jgi:hypothetical protein
MSYSCEPEPSFNTNRSSAWATAIRLHDDCGFSVVPVVPALKHPPIPWKPYQEERPDPKQLDQWAAKYPTYNTGIVTGRISGIVVVECDDDEAKQTVLQRCKYTRMIQKSGSGKSTHYVYRYPRQLPEGWEKIPTVAKISVGGRRYHLDIRGDGGMIVCPGSLHAETGKPYTMVEQWTPELLALAPEFDPSWLDVEAPYKAAEYEPFTCDVPLNDRQQRAREILGKNPGSRRCARPPDSNW